MNTYSVELPNGKIVNRNSKRVYTHAVISLEVIDGVTRNWVLDSFASSEELAIKAAKVLDNRIKREDNCYKGTTFKVVPVGVAA